MSIKKKSYLNFFVDLMDNKPLEDETKYLSTDFQKNLIYTVITVWYDCVGVQTICKFGAWYSLVYIIVDRNRPEITNDTNILLI